MRLSVLVLAALLAVSAFGQGKQTLGKLGQTIGQVSIHSKASERSRVFYRLGAYQYLVVRPGQGGWVRVLMSNGQWGYADANKVAQLPYEVSQPSAGRNGRATMPASRTGSALAQYSLNYIGTPYVWGGNDPNRGIDCSGFVKQMFGRIGVSLPRTAAEQALVGQRISRLEELQPGDRLYFWEARRNKIGHTGIYMGNGWFVHSSSGKGVNTDRLDRGNWLRTLVAARR